MLNFVVPFLLLSQTFMNRDKNSKIYNSTEQKSRSSAKGNSPFLLFLRLLISPNSGWRRIKGAKTDPQAFASIVFYRLLALMCLAQFCVLFHEPDKSISLIIQHAIIAFVAFFGAYFACYAISCAVLPPTSRAKMSGPFGRILVLGGMSVFLLGYILSLLAPNLDVLLWLGAFYSMYIVCRGVKFLRVPSRESVAVCSVVAALNILITIAIGWLLLTLMPKV